MLSDIKKFEISHTIGHKYSRRDAVSIMADEFREVPGYPGCVVGKEIDEIRLLGRTMPIVIDVNGYKVVNVIVVDDEGDEMCVPMYCRLSIHRAKALAYLPNPNNHPVVHHRNHNRLDNSLDNLDWASYSRNCQDVKRGTGASEYLGVSYSKASKTKPWIRTQVKIEGKLCAKSKSFATEEEAAEAYDEVQLMFRKEAPPRLNAEIRQEILQEVMDSMLDALCGKQQEPEKPQETQPVIVARDIVGLIQLCWWFESLEKDKYDAIMYPAGWKTKFRRNAIIDKNK
jgi:hypothetical protein